jgi:hypothetical protein
VYLVPSGRSTSLTTVIVKGSDLEKPLTVHQVEVLQKSVGSAGFFNRIGLVGIPLAVALLACILYVLVFVARKFNLQEASAFMDLAKLTTGAFIGAMATSRNRPAE